MRILLGEGVRSHQHFLPETRWFGDLQKRRWGLCPLSCSLVENKAFTFSLGTGAVSISCLYVQSCKQMLLSYHRASVSCSEALLPLIGVQERRFAHIHAYQQRRHGLCKAECGTERKNTLLEWMGSEKGKWFVCGEILHYSGAPAKYLQSAMPRGVCALYRASPLHIRKSWRG